MEKNFKYYAFISYKREDEKWAKWLQNKLETYKLPTSLAKETGKDFPKTFHPCFRDKTDLSETGDLSKILQDKLQKSQYLIVVCSPRSAKSKWVNKEIETFQTMGRADKIIPFIIEGNPDTSNPNTHCYPSTLDENILGISISELGKEKATVKTIAVMSNISFDTLWNRHRERILKKRVNLSLLIAFVMLIFGGVFVWQNIKISEQYKRAEKLINAFYFYDNKFALAYGSKDSKNAYLQKFYFIDKNGDAVEKLGRWEKAEQFDIHTGFTKVIDSDKRTYLLDTLGNAYKYTNRIDELDNTIEALDLSFQMLSKLPEVIGNYDNLRYLDLSYNELSDLPSEIGNLANLTFLDLKSNKLDFLPTEIGNLTKLKHLDLGENYQISVLPPKIGELTNLGTLRLSDNQFTRLPPEIGKLTNLKKLDLSRNQLISLPPEIGKLTNLTELDLFSNQLTSLPPEIGRLANLKILILEYNQLTSLPPEIGKLTNLTTLDLSWNGLTSLPSEIGILNRLIELDLSCSKLLSLPSEIGKLTNLTELYLEGNQLISLPPEIKKLKNLTILSLCNNQLTSLPTKLEKLTNLTELFLHDNQLTSLPSEIGKLKKLTILCLKYNQLISLPTKIDKLTNLIYFDCEGNPIDSLSIKRAEKFIEIIERNRGNNNSGISDSALNLIRLGYRKIPV